MEQIHEQLGGKVEYWVYRAISGEIIVESENNQMWSPLNPSVDIHKTIEDAERVHPRLKGKLPRG